MIQLNLANVVTIALAGMLGYGALVGIAKGWQMVQGGAGGTATSIGKAIGPS